MARLDLSLSPQELDEYLSGQRTARVATVDSDGRPHVIPLWFVWMDGALFVNTTRGNRSVRNLDGNPAAAATIDDGETYDELRGITMAGEMRAADDDPQLDEVVAAFSRKYFGGNAPHFAAWRNRFFLKLVPDRVSSWDFRKIPEARARRDAARARTRSST
jgi:nitroimidazol reductase NimA-like FMN-containing flavoprotein (pyridoxamine 5'-phosphate oxidase superfamily)